jgi:hypothetical protein
MQMRLLGNVVAIDPRQWKTQWDVTVNVGLGTGDKSQQLVQLQTIAAVQKELLMAGKSWVTDDNLYNMARKIAESAGFQNEGMFFTPPKNVPPQEPAPDPEMMKLQAESQISQAELEQQSQEKQLSAQMQKYVADLQAQTQVTVIEIQEQSKQEIAKFNAENEARMAIFEQNNAVSEASKVEQKMMQQLTQAAQQIMSVQQELSQNVAEMQQAQAAQQNIVKKLVGVATGARKIVRDDMGNAVGVEVVPSDQEDINGPVTLKVLN